MMVNRNVNQTELSKLTGISKSSISQYLSGHNIPSRVRVCMIADVLSCDVEELMGDWNKKNNTINSDKNISVAEAAKRMGKSMQFVRVSLQKGIAPFGFAVQISSNRWSYHISPKKFEEYLSKERGVDAETRNNRCTD
jgi:transcriptional regulator with XRE-family HTH domain